MTYKNLQQERLFVAVKPKKYNRIARKKPGQKCNIHWKHQLIHKSEIGTIA